MNTRIWRCVTCYRVNPTDSTSCSKCGLPQHADPEPGYRTAAKVFYCFQTVIMIFGIATVLASKLGFLLSVGILLIFWWFGLAIFAAQPIGGTFDLERREARAFIELQTSPVGRRIVQTAYVVLYWPIFISKNIYFGLIICAAVIHYSWKFHYG